MQCTVFWEAGPEHETAADATRSEAPEKQLVGRKAEATKDWPMARMSGVDKSLGRFDR